jgi:hypothetical protein
LCTLFDNIILPHTIIMKDILYINLSQAEKKTGLRRDQLKNLIISGDVQGSRVSYKTYLIHFDSLIQYIEERTVQPIKRVAPNV